MCTFSNDYIQNITASLFNNDNNDKNLIPKFIFNDYNNGFNLLTELQTELDNCKEFYFAVAFITQSGLICLKEILNKLNDKNITGYILTTDYLYFTQPKALKELMHFPNLKIRIYSQENFHVKGYIFKHEDYYSAIIGSSNLTQNALKANKEWNLKIKTLYDNSICQNILQEFWQMWQQAIVLNDTWLNNYEQYYRQNKQNSPLKQISQIKFTPNKMQVEALSSIEKLRQNEQTKALLISATGTGKTYLSAFAVQKAKPRKLLFLVHREQILKQAANTFKRVLGDVSIGFLSGTHKDFSAPYLFSTISMMAKDDILSQFTPTYFDYIIIDETHRAGAKSYRKILNYFKPQFLLGMTATPNRSDGFDIYKLFDYNIAYEIHLKEAMQENMLCPFHYFGITDITIDNQEIDDISSFNLLTSDERVEHIIKKAQFYGYSGERVKGLIFCRNIEEAHLLSQKFNEKSFYTTTLCGEDSQETRENALSRLEQSNRQNGLDYIFTVDIMNEGIDIPAVNQIIMLRPTKSSIIFVQQMGRGLRKYPDKDYVVILDFIGNYQNNFMIPIALFGDTSYNKDTIRRYVAEGNRLLPGCSTINFDEISRHRIYAAIDSARLSDSALLKNEYLNLKQKLGHIPKIEDFSKFGSISITKFFDKFGSYHNFLQKYDKDYTIKLSPAQEEILSFICHRFAKGKRIFEILALQILLDNPINLLKQMQISLEKIYHHSLTDFEKISIINNLTNEFTISNERAKYANCIFIKPLADDFTIDDNFSKILQTENFARILQEILSFAQAQYEKHYINHYRETNFVLYQKYTYEEVCHLLNWPNKINPNAMAGYFYEKTTHTMPVFINYIASNKKRVDYANEFLSNDMITAFSKANRKLNSTDAQHIYNAKKEQNKLYLFVRKPNEDKEAKEFYFLGEISAIGEPEYAEKYNGFKIIYKLHTPVREDIFDYFSH